MRAFTLGFLFLTVSCGSEPNSILVMLSSLPPRTDHVTVSATLAGKPAMATMDITNPRDQFGVKLPEEATGRLMLNIAAVDTDGCAHGLAAPEFDLPLSYTSTTLSLMTQTPRKCLNLPACDANTVCSITKPVSTHFEGFWAFSPKDIWGVGHMGTIVHYDGASWTPYDFGLSPPSGDFYGVWGSAPDDIWAVGSFGLIAHYTGGKWAVASSPTTRDLYGVYGISKTEIWAVGQSSSPTVTQGIFLQYNGSNWLSIATAGTDTFNGVWADNSSGSRFIYACGNSGLLVRYDASQTPAWSVIISNTSANLRGIWGTPSTKAGTIDSTVFAVGSGGAILRIRYATDPGWAMLSNTGTTQTLYGVRGDATAKLVFAYGQNGTVVRAADPYDTFVAQSSSASGNLFGAAFGGNNLVWLGGSGGYLGFVDLNP